MLVACIFDDGDITEVEKAESFVSVVKRRLISDTTNDAHANGIDQPPQDGPVNEYQAKVREVAGLECGKLIRGALEHFPEQRFDITELAPLMNEGVATLHSWAAQLGKSCKHRNIEVFERHGGSPLKMSIRPEARRVLQSTLATDATN